MVCRRSHRRKGCSARWADLGSALGSAIVVDQHRWDHLPWVRPVVLAVALLGVRTECRVRLQCSGQTSPNVAL
jgi:hypothetical protein